ncbi:hypothetical protein GQX74_002261 [Glossina fuscipes]|nr:hypothetical protein GQX74_002261 [Glossina fuscipes]
MLQNCQHARPSNMINEFFNQIYDANLCNGNLKSVEFRICEQTALDYRLCIPLSIAYSINRSKLSTKLYAKRWSKLEIGFQLNSGASLSVINCLGSGYQRLSKDVI